MAGGRAPRPPGRDEAGPRREPGPRQAGTCQARRREARRREAGGQARGQARCQARACQDRREEASRRQARREEGSREEAREGPPLTPEPAPLAALGRLDRPVATGVGSLPGTDPVEAARVVAGELPDLPHLPELPGRGPGADMVGRAFALLPDLYADLQPSGWRLVPRPGLDTRRARDFLAWDLDAAEQAWEGYAGPFKVQVCGPWTLAAGVELQRGDRALSDRGAVRDLADALHEAVGAHVAEVRRRIPGADVVVQLDEPSLPAVLNGRVPTASGFGTLRAVPRHEITAALRAEGRGVHCCAGDVPLDVLRGAAFVSLDLALLGTRQYDALAELLDGGTVLFAGSTDSDAVARLRRSLGVGRIVVTPPCGLAGATPDGARATLKRVREIATRLAEEEVE